jgi:hypothetical protein
MADTQIEHSLHTHQKDTGLEGLITDEHQLKHMQRIAEVMRLTKLNPAQAEALLGHFQKEQKPLRVPKVWSLEDYQKHVSEQLKENETQIKQVWRARINSGLKTLISHPEKLSEAYKVFAFLNITLNNFKTSNLKVDGKDDEKTKIRKEAMRKEYFDRVNPLVNSFIEEVSDEIFTVEDQKFRVRLRNVTLPDKYKKFCTSMVDMYASKVEE